MESAYQDRRCTDPWPDPPTARRSARSESRPAAWTPAPANPPAHTLQGTSPPGAGSQPRSASGNLPPHRCPPTHRSLPPQTPPRRPRTALHLRTAHRLPPLAARTGVRSLPENLPRRPRHPRPWQCRPDPMSSSQTAVEPFRESVAHPPPTRLPPRSSHRPRSTAHRSMVPQVHLQCPWAPGEDSRMDRPPGAAL